jgi:hypothetical protein
MPRDGAIIFDDLMKAITALYFTLPIVAPAHIAKSTLTNMANHNFQP